MLWVEPNKWLNHLTYDANKILWTQIIAKLLLEKLIVGYRLHLE